MNPDVDVFVNNAQTWREERKLLRGILLDFPLEEELKWGEPCYTSQGKNVVLIGGFRDYCTLLFFKGALLKDPFRVLVAPGKTQAGRQIRFKNLEEIAAQEVMVRTYIQEAIDIETSGRKVELKSHSEYIPPDELQKKLNESPELKAAFESLTPGRQRAYMHHFSAPKQAVTRAARVEKCIQQILEGRGLNE